MNIPNWQKLLGALIYLLPWSDAIPFGSNLFLEFSFLQWLAIPALPIIVIEQTIPFGSLIIFFALYLGVIRNSSIPYFIRFNTLQALLIDITVILTTYAFRVLVIPIGINMILKTLSSTIFIGMLAIVVFALIQCIKGEEPNFPAFTDAAKSQL